MTTTSTHTQAPAPRSGYNLTVSLGLLNIPVKYHQAKQDDAVGIKRSQFTADGHPVGSMPYDKQTGATVEKDGIIKKAQVDDVWVEVTDEEIETYTSNPDLMAGVASIETFVPVESIGREYVVADTYYVRPAPIGSGRSAKQNPAAEKAFALLVATMETKGVAALFRIPTSRSVAKWAALLPDGRMVTLRYASEVRVAPALPEPSHSVAEAALAAQLIDSLGVSTPVLEDEATPQLRTYLEAKAAGQKPEAPVATAIGADVLDLEAALAASLKVA
jgi:non-homologous end joining protein Ku